MSCKRAIFGTAMLGLLAACSTNPHAEVGAGDPFLGESVRYNAAVQTINPDPVYGPEDAKPGDNGDKGADAVQRYRTDAVKPVERVMTSQSTTGSGSSSPSTPR